MKTAFIILALTFLLYANAKQRRIAVKPKQAFTFKAFAEGTSDASIVRHLLHDSDYGALANHFVWDSLEGYAGANIQLFSDGPKANGTGHPYFCLHPKDPITVNAREDDTCALFVTEGVIQERCDDLPLGIKDYDCPRAEILGNCEEVPQSSDEWKQAHSWFAEKYPGFKNIGEEDGYELWKLTVKTVFILKNDEPIDVSLDDYFAAEPATWNVASSF